MSETANMQDARISKQPRAGDPGELAIRESLDAELTTEWSRETINELRERQEEFFQFALEILGDPKSIYNHYSDLLTKISYALKTEIVAGEDYLKTLESAKGIIVVTNHLGTAKLTRIENSDRHLPINLDSIEPFPIRHAPLVLTSKALSGRLVETAVELPSPLLEVQKACGVITVAPEGEMRAAKLLEDIREAAQNYPGTVFVMYPEGGTSGKRNGGKPYFMDKFHKGAFYIARYLGLPVLPVCQYLNPQKGMELYILKPYQLNKNDNLDKAMSETKKEMQETLNNATYSK